LKFTFETLKYEREFGVVAKKFRQKSIRRSNIQKEKRTKINFVREKLSEGKKFGKWLSELSLGDYLLVELLGDAWLASIDETTFESS
jgi:hypothetical protein